MIVCARCGIEATHLVRTYWESRWNETGGMCTECCKGACEYFDETGWPDHPEQKEEQ